MKTQEETVVTPQNRKDLMETISGKVTVVRRRMTMFGVISVILGLAAMLAPAVTGLSIVLTVGVLVVAAGALRMLWAFGSETFGKGVLTFAIGGLTLLCGFMLVSEPIFAFGFLTILLTAYLFADGIAEIAGAFKLSRDGGRFWLLASGVISLLLGVMMWQQFPMSGGWAIGFLLGFKLLVSGIVMLALANKMRALSA